jgi:hypothetical protein
MWHRVRLVQQAEPAQRQHRGERGELQVDVGGRGQLLRQLGAG